MAAVPGIRYNEEERKKDQAMLQPHSYQPPEDGLPPQEVRIKGLLVEPWPEDGRRVRIQLDVTPFAERPNLEVVITDESGKEVSSINIIESIDARMTFTMHIRSNSIERQYTAKASIVYPEIGMVDEKSINFETHQTTE